MCAGEKHHCFKEDEVEARMTDKVRKSSRLTIGFPVGCYLQTKLPRAMDPTMKKKVKASLMVMETGCTDGTSKKLFKCWQLDSGYNDMYKSSEMEYPDFMKAEVVQCYGKVFKGGYSPVKWQPYKVLFKCDEMDTATQNNQKVYFNVYCCQKWDMEKLQVVEGSEPEHFGEYHMRLIFWAGINDQAPSLQDPFERTILPEKRKAGQDNTAEPENVKKARKTSKKESKKKPSKKKSKKKSAGEKPKKKSAGEKPKKKSAGEKAKEETCGGKDQEKKCGGQSQTCKNIQCHRSCR